MRDRVRELTGRYNYLLRTGNTADYDIRMAGFSTCKAALDSHETADKIRHLLNRCSDASIRAQMKTNILAWRNRLQT